MQEYVLGFMFDHSRRFVALIEKKRPVLQAGLWNGIGGKIENGETPSVAMAREFFEETGVVTSEGDWRQYVKLIGVDYTVHCFTTIGSPHQVRRQEGETEEPSEVSLDYLPPHDKMMPNVRWLIAMALCEEVVQGRYVVTNQDIASPVPASESVIGREELVSK